MGVWVRILVGRAFSTLCQGALGMRYGLPGFGVWGKIGVSNIVEIGIRLGIGLGIGLGIWLGIWDWDLGLGFGIGLPGIGIWDWDLGLGFGLAIGWL